MGLILVMPAGAKLFTGNNLVVTAWANRQITTRSVMTNRVLVYEGIFS